MEEKNLLRKKMRARRKSLSEIERETFSNEIIKKFLSQEIYQTSEIIMAYVSTAEEVQLQKIFTDAFNRKKILAVPLIVGKILTHWKLESSEFWQFAQIYEKLFSRKKLIAWLYLARRSI